jgi:hypothetical protein
MTAKLVAGVAGLAMVAFLSAALRPNTRPATWLTCQGSSSQSDELRHYLQALVSDTHATYANRVRSSMGLSSTLDTSAVALVSVDSVCTRVTYAVDSAFGRSPSPVSLIVVRFGPLYGAFDQRIVTGSSFLNVVDSTFTYVKTITY